MTDKRTFLSLAISLVFTLSFIQPCHASTVNFAEFGRNLDRGLVEFSNQFSWTGDVDNGVAVTPNCVPCLAAIGVLVLVTTLGDPQDALLIDSFKVNGLEIVDDLIDEALQPSNRIFEDRVPNLLNGATFFGSRAFSGEAFLNNSESALPIGFGVFVTDADEKLFTPVIFAPTLQELRDVTSYRFDLRPIISDTSTGTFEATARHLIVVAVDEPPTLFLMAVGILAIIYWNWRRWA